MTCVVLPRLEIRNANAQPTWWIIGPPGPTSYCGFAHALARAVDCTSELQGVIPLHHDYELLADGNNNSPHQFRSATLIDHNDHVAASGVKYGALSSQPSARCNLTITIVLQFEHDTRINPTAIKQFLATARVAGGTFFSFKEPIITESIEDIHLSGFGIHERLDLMTDDPMALIEQCHPNNNPHPWLMPTTLGYQAITAPQHKSLARSKYPHAFAEPLVGPVQYISARKSSPPLWRQSTAADGTYIVTTSQE